MAAKCREKGWSRHPEPDALEHEGLWSELDRSTGCEVMRSPGPHGKDGLTLWIQTAKRNLSSRCIGTREKFHHYIRGLLMAPRGQGAQRVCLDPRQTGPLDWGPWRTHQYSY